jgi:glycosyltransferase involved in cell wall biosynthesis
MTSNNPLVSIITATYNRSNILPYTIASVLRSTFEDWELLVVGDACTDDTEQVVSAFNDPRIRFFNLAQNVGEQSGPNNGVWLSS